ncbi:hypothetical protein [Thomasclavelia cocleata]|jgi:hypothetical protein|uniref:hypothetical protein n=1 Tax=Thomasclavelia cocleata TaxID=69824 RepID=UPI0024300D3F|nr:hypothetical protein [Thomasclavelia cocleata]
MRSMNDYKIIINKGKTKQKLFLFLSLNEFAIALFFGLVLYKLCGYILSELFALLIGIGSAVAIASLFVEIPSDHLSVLDHIKLMYQYYFVKPHEFFYYRYSKMKYKEVDDNEFVSNDIKEERYKAKRKKKRK